MSFLKKTIFTGLSALLLGISSGCAELKYYNNLVQGHVEILFNKQNIDEVVQDPAVAEETKRKLRLTQDARKYAFEKLHLPNTEAYTKYVDLDKLRTGEDKNSAKKEKNAEESTKEEQDYVVVFITACRSLQFEVKEWWYPFVGTQQMRTFYDKKEAEVYAHELQQEGWDIDITESRAYSTGKFLNNPLLDEPLGDPVTNVMLNQSDADIIEYLFHEIAHQVIYVDGDTAFNESFAEFVGEEGTREYLKDHQQEFSKTLNEKKKRRKDEDLFQEIITSYSGWLDLLYTSQLPDEEKLKKKKKIFQAMKDAYLQESEPLGAGRRRWFVSNLNNAHLIGVQHYSNDIDEFAALFEYSAHRNWEEFYDIVKNIAGWPETKRKEYFEQMPTSMKSAKDKHKRVAQGE